MQYSMIDDIRALSDIDLLQSFFHVDSQNILAECKGSWLSVLARHHDSIQQRMLLAGVEIARRASCEELETKTPLSSPDVVREYLQFHFLGCEEERFCAIWLDVQNKPIAVDELFRGTLTQTSVYPREVTKRALKRNAAAVIFAHNHPSGSTEPSPADKTITEILKRALALIETRVLDHFIVGAGTISSFSERGLL